MAITTTSPIGATTISAGQWGQRVVDDLTSLDTRVTAIEGKTWTSGKIVSTSGSLIISGIPAGLRQLELSWTARCDAAAGAAALNLQVNNTSSVSYFGPYREIQGATQGTSLNSAGASSGRVGTIPGATAGAGRFSTGTVRFAVWSPSNNKLGFKFDSFLFDGASNSFFTDGGVVFEGAGPYVTLTLTPSSGSFVSGTEATARGQF